MVGLPHSSGPASRPPSFLPGGAVTLGAGPALEQLKKTVNLLAASGLLAFERCRLKRLDAGRPSG